MKLLISMHLKCQYHRHYLCYHQSSNSNEIKISFLIQTTTAATDPDYNYDFAAGIHANTTENSQNISSGKDYGCIIGFFEKDGLYVWHI